MDGKIPEASPRHKRILDYVDITTLKKILNAFTTTTNLMANIVDVEGISIFSKKDVEKCSKFCRIIYGLENGIERCRSAYKRAGKQASIFGEPYIFRCPSGLIEWAAPIKVNEEHIGTVICGQVLMWEPEEFFWIELREMNKDIISDFQPLFQAVEELPVITGPQVQAAAYLLYVVANYIMEAGWKNYNQIEEYSNLSSMYHAEIENKKNSEKQFDCVNSVDSLIEENEIVVQLYGNEKKAKGYLQNLIAIIRYESGNHLTMMRSKIAELLIVLSRVTGSMGMDAAYSSEIINEYIPRIFDANSIENLNIITLKAIDRYLEGVKKISSKSSHGKVSAIMRFIENNYMHELTLEKISGSIYLSPSYAGRMFKDNTGMSIMTYVNKVRIAKAKKFLLNPHYQIEGIAQNVGFTDASYFTKVFKKVEGISPTHFRKHK